MKNFEIYKHVPICNVIGLAPVVTNFTYIIGKIVPSTADEKLLVILHEFDLDSNEKGFFPLSLPLEEVLKLWPEYNERNYVLAKMELMNENLQLEQALFEM